MGKGGGEAHVPYEEPDNLESRQILSIIDLICEGEIDGIKDGLKGVYLNDTPVQSKSGEYNFKGIDAEWVAGTQGQQPLKAFPATENEVPVGLEVKKDTPIVRTVTDQNIDRIRVTVGASALYKQEENGDIVGTSVTMLIQVSRGAIWQNREKVTISGKTRSQFLKSVIISQLPDKPFNIRVVRETADSDSLKLANKTIWSSYTEIFDIRLSYPNTAVGGLKFDSSQFSGVPRRNYLIRGMIVKIPDNYDPIARTYDGIWTGNFKTDWTDNPAWVLYDLITNNRYGLGNRISAFGIDKFQLYSVAQYCDKFVPDGFGNQEPRFTCNAYITSQRQAYDIINDLCSIFRAMPVWDGTQLSAILDRASDPVAIYSNANVVGGEFNYSNSSRKDRHNVVHVKYLDKDNGWKGATEYVADDALIIKYGINVKQVEAFGCTSRGQAHRVGRWLIQTEKLEKQTSTFALGREALRHLPGDIIILVDNNYNTSKYGGRIISFDGNTATLDRDVSAKYGDIFTYTKDGGVPIKVTIQSNPDPNKIVLTEQINPSQNSIWAINSANAEQRLFRALTISDNSDGTYQVVALEHNPNKEKIVDQGAVFDEIDPNPIYPIGIPPVENLAVEVVPESNTFQARLTWSVPRTIQDLQFEVKLLKDEKVANRNIVSNTFSNIADLDLGKYNANVRGVDKDGRVGNESSISFTISPPKKPIQISLQPAITSVTVIPRAAPGSNLGTFFEFWKGENVDDVINKKNYIGRGLTIVDADCLPDTIYFYGVNSINAVGRSDLVIGNTKTLPENEGAGAGGGFFRVQTDDGIFPASDDDATKLFYERFKIYPQIDTVMIVYALDESGQVVHSESKMYDGGKWVTPGIFLDGNLIATGTIKGDRITAGTEITAPKIKGGELNVNNRFTVSNEGDVTIIQKNGAAGMTMTNKAIRIYDEEGRLVVQIGDLSSNDIRY